MYCAISAFKASQLVDAEPKAAEELLCYLEAAVTDSLEQRGISRLAPLQTHSYFTPQCALSSSNTVYIYK